MILCHVVIHLCSHSFSHLSPPPTARAAFFPSILLASSVSLLQEVNAQNLKAMGHYLTQTLAAEKEVRAQAVQFLAQNEGAPGYAILLMATTHAETEAVSVICSSRINHLGFGLSVFSLSHQGSLESKVRNAPSSAPKG